MFSSPIKALALVALMPVLIARGAAIKSGDCVVASNDGAKLMFGETVRAELAKGTEINVLSVRGTWLGSHVIVDGEEKKGWVKKDEVWPKVDVTIPSLTTFSLKQINPIREKAQEAALGDRHVPEGWSKCKGDPGKVVEVFECLRIRKGFVLRAYQYGSEGDIWGLICAMPTDSTFPKPLECGATNFMFGPGKPPQPPDALDGPMAVFDGDGSPWSYICASLLVRELGDFGAQWHGVGWGWHQMLEENPWKADGTGRPSDFGIRKRDPKGTRWKVLEQRPKQWRPHVRMEKGQITVTFYTWTNRNREAIFKHVDTYKPGSYCSRIEFKEIAKGPPGICP